MSEFPPVIIDSIGLCDDSVFNRPDMSGLVAHSADFAQDGTETAALRASITSLYLIRDNQVKHHGDFGPNEIELVYSRLPELTMTAGAEDLIPGAEAGLDAGATAGESTGSRRSRRVTSIRTGGSEL